MTDPSPVGEFPIYKAANVKDLIPYVRNSRTHSEEQVIQIAASIKEFGFTNPILVDGENGIIAGHGRIMAARKLGLDVVPTIELSHLSEAQKKAYIIADNKLALNAGWDDEMLRLEFEELGDLDFDLELTGFDLLEMTNIFDDEATAEEQDLKEENYSESFSIIIECESEENQKNIFNKLDTEGYKCRVQSL